MACITRSRGNGRLGGIQLAGDRNWADVDVTAGADVDVTAWADVDVTDGVDFDVVVGVDRDVTGGVDRDVTGGVDLSVTVASVLCDLCTGLRSMSKVEVPGRSS